MDVMFLRKKNRRVEVYAYDAVNNVALIFEPGIAARNPGNGGGWQKVKLSALMPIQYINPVSGAFQSKTEKNYYKSKLHLVAATWQCTDGTIFDHSDIEKAIEYERSLDTENTNCCEGDV